MSTIANQQAKALAFHQLHQEGNFLLLPNIWDALGAALVEDMGFPAIATASASIAYTNGYRDGQKIPFQELLAIVKKIAGAGSLPVTVDMESGYAPGLEELKDNTRRLLSLGIVGINLEDVEQPAGRLYSLDEQAERISAIRAVANEMQIPLFINARTDVFLRDDKSNWNKIRDELVKRAIAYMDAGASGFFPVALAEKHQISEIVSAVPAPVNIVAFPGVPEIAVLKQLGVRRLSLGPGLLRWAIRSMKQALTRLREEQGLDELAGNEVTTAYFAQLIRS